MDIEDIRNQVLALVADVSYMPMRKRGLAKALEISDEDYHDFKHLLDEMVTNNELAELKRGKFGLPLGDGNGRRHAPPVARPYSKEEQAEDFTDEHLEKFKKLKEQQAAAPKGARVGRIEVKRGGMGFLISEPPGNDLFIAAEDLGGALSGDLVAVEMKRRVQGGSGRGRFGRGGRGGGGFSRPAGRVIKILERAHPRIVGTFHAHHRRGDMYNSGPVGHIIPDTRGMFEQLDVLAENRGDAQDKDKVAIELVEAKQSHRSGQLPTAKVVKVFGRAGEAEADIAAILENFDVRQRIPPEVLAAADAVPEEIPAEELAQRTDYTQPVTFTIDPADAKDHDDAVAIRREADGRMTLLVHIADVSYYVQENSVIDLEARDRATSVYLPGTVYPMLPPRLSNGMCSLKEGQLRLTKTVSMTFGPNMTMQEIKLERSYIRSAAFLTYDTVRDAIDNNKPELVRTPEIFETLKVMKEFAAALRARRLSTGSIDLNMPETKLLLDEKLEVTGWTQVEHHWAHELIEDMMLAANRAVAEYLVNYELPGLFRIHEDPDPEALDRFVEFVREFGISVRPPLDRMKIKSVLDRIRGKEYAHTISLALLTSLKQAKYSASCTPHFALNFSRYLHFTSPIRRYPDLIVHRALDTRLEPGKAELPQGKRRKGGKAGGDDYFERLAFLRPLAMHCSQRERLADQAEEEVKKFRQMQFLRRNIKESHPGIITSVRDFGIFVEMQDCFVEGLVRVQDLADDYYEYYEDKHLLQGRRHRRSFRLGDKVTVRVLDIDLGSKKVALEIV